MIGALHVKDFPEVVVVEVPLDDLLIANFSIRMVILQINVLIYALLSPNANLVQAFHN